MFRSLSNTVIELDFTATLDIGMGRLQFFLYIVEAIFHHETVSTCANVTNVDVQYLFSKNRAARGNKPSFSFDDVIYELN